MNEKKIKVTDKRLFTQEGELKEEFRHLEDEASPSAPPPEPASPQTAPPPEPVEPSASPQTAPPPEPAESSAPPDAEPAPSELEPSFFDLVAAVAQPIALYLGDVKMPDGESMENLQLARLHIDLLEILQQKSVGNLNDQEKGFLQDLLYQLRLRYVEKTEQSSEN